MNAARFGFSRESRLIVPSQFRAVFEQAERSQDALLVVLARRNSNGVARLGLAISKKCVRRAVDRNRIKRQIRESFRHRHHSLGSLDIVVLARQGILRADFADIRKSLERHWNILVKRCDSYCCGSSSFTDS